LNSLIEETSANIKENEEIDTSIVKYLLNSWLASSNRKYDRV